MPIPIDDLVQQVAELYEHLYDLPFLRTHPLGDVLLADPSLARDERGQRIHLLLRDFIKELEPLPHAPTPSREWRRYRLMVLRYLDGLDPLAVAHQLGISRRQYYRDRDEAIETVADLLRDRYLKIRPAFDLAPMIGAESSSSHLDLLRLEATRMAQPERMAHMGEILDGVCSVVREMLQRRGLSICVSLEGSLPDVAIDQGLLRQLLLAAIGSLSEGVRQATLILAAQAIGPVVQLSVMVEPPEAAVAAGSAVQEQLAALQEMAAVSGVSVDPILSEGSPVGIRIKLAKGHEYTVLVVDDNRDLLELFRRYLGLHYRVLTARTASEALTTVIGERPRVLILDLMMPDHDGWSLLQTLLNQPHTCDIPIIVCSVLKQRELALSLGATAFLEKPVSQQVLLDAVADAMAC